MAETPLSDVLLGLGLPFDVDGKTFYLRAPSPEEYDDAMSLQAAVRKRALATPEIAEMRELPASDSAALLVDGAIAQAETELAELADEDDAKRDVLTRRLDGLKQMREGRTLADEIAEERGILARDRWLALRLLSDETGKPLVPLSMVRRDSWAQIPLRVRDAARPVLWELLGTINDLPFGWAAPPASKSS